MRGQVSRGCRAVSQIIPLCQCLSPLIQVGGSQVTAESVYPVSLSLGLKSFQLLVQLFAKPEAPGLTLFRPIPSIFLFRRRLYAVPALCIANNSTFCAKVAVAKYSGKTDLAARAGEQHCEGNC